jgi:hypothetical protein
MNAASPSFFLLLCLCGALAYGLMPVVFPAVAILCMLLGSYPLIAIVLAVVWLVRRLLWDAVLAFVVGWAGGLGLRASGFAGRWTRPPPRRRIRQHPPRQPRVSYRREGAYFPWPESGDDLPEHLGEEE